MKRFTGFCALVFCLTATTHAREAVSDTRPADVSDGLPSLAHTSVSIPWEELRGLMDRGKVDGSQPPVDFVFATAAYKGSIENSQVIWSVTCDVTLLTEGWALVPLGSASAGIVSATIDGKTAPLVLRGEMLFTLLQGKGEKKLAITVEREVVAKAEEHRIEQPLLPTPLVAVTLTLPSADLDVAAAGALGVRVVQQGNATVLSASYRGGTTAAVSWKPRPAAAPGEARLYGQTETLVSVEKGLARTRSIVHLQCERAAVGQVKLRVDAKSVVLHVKGPDVARWSEAADADGKTLSVEFTAAAIGDRTIEVLAEHDLPDAGGTVELAPPAVVGGRKDAGQIAVRVGAGQSVTPGASSAERVSVSDLPLTLRGDQPDQPLLAYRYDAQPATITLNTEPTKAVATSLLATTATRVLIERGMLRCRANVSVDVLHTGVDSLRVILPEGVELESVTGPTVLNSQAVTEGKQRILVINLKDLVTGTWSAAVQYTSRFDEKKGSPVVPLVAIAHATQNRGYVGIEVKDGVEVTPKVEGATRIDVRELPQDMWSSARTPLLFGYRYDEPKAAISLGLTRNQDVDVLVAMSDICEASTTVTPDGKTVTKAIYIVRNNLKQYMTLHLPEGASVWSAFVNDHPVSPVRNAKGDVLIPLQKSEAVEEDDEKSYRAVRERRRAEGANGQREVLQQAKRLKDWVLDEPAEDLKPYDVEIVYVSGPLKLAERGQLQLSLPQSDVPVGLLSWAVFLPHPLRVTDTTGNVGEVEAFSLPFRHFGEAQWAKQKQQSLEKVADMAKAMQEAAQAQQKLAEHAKAQGVLPVRIESPIIGDIHRFEKFLAVDEMPTVTLTYGPRPQ